ncbi:hemopexin repeat-containing protein [Candidatus Uabimicrobium amorphum]|uniref:hemopexin repeat-containing protein n=1 Tax=Uabimicrobium amorphum TaxID=2596890 RepID=UPI0015658981|nr:hemopexin repeat-containing protein [Candidatus Uabimicrobium amorphum]
MTVVRNRHRDDYGYGYDYVYRYGYDYDLSKTFVVLESTNLLGVLRMFRTMLIVLFCTTVLFSQDTTFEMIYKIKTLEDKVKILEKQLERLEYLELRVLELEKRLNDKHAVEQPVEIQPVPPVTPPQQGINAICSWQSRGSYYFFKGNKYVKQGNQASAAKAIAANWNGLWSDVDAAIEFNNNKIYFFKGRHYRTYDMKTYKLGKKNNIASNWSGLWSSGIDAAVRWGDNIYFFKGSQYLSYSMKTYKSSAPKPIAGNWSGLWANGIDAGVTWNNGYIYFFKGSEFMRYNQKTYKTEGPWPISSWKGLDF